MRDLLNMEKEVKSVNSKKCWELHSNLDLYPILVLTLYLEANKFLAPQQSVENTTNEHQ